MAEQNIKQIKHAREMREVNAYLDAGWVLLNVNPGQSEDGSAWPLYILGWAQEGKPRHVDPREWM